MFYAFFLHVLLGTLFNWGNKSGKTIEFRQTVTDTSNYNSTYPLQSGFVRLHMQLHLHFVNREFVRACLFYKTTKQKVEETFVSPSRFLTKFAFSYNGMTNF